MKGMMIPAMMLALMLCIMAAEAGSDKEFNVGRAFAHCTKLYNGNYDIWYTGLVSTLAGITGIRHSEM